MNLREIRELQALGNYWRICLYFSEAARSHARWFCSMEMRAIPSYPQERWRGLKHFVHAEVQILLDSELRHTHRAPRYIGTSKKACFLCYCFINHHGKYVVDNSHAEVHPQWTVPGSALIGKENRLRIAAALGATARDVGFFLKQARKTPQRRPQPLQSTINLLSDVLRTPSLSTILSATVVSQHSPVPAECQGGDDGVDDVRTSSVHSRHTSNTEVDRTSNTARTMGAAVCVSTPLPGALKLDWLELFIEPEDSIEEIVAELGGRAASERTTPMRCRLKQLHLSGELPSRTVDLSKLAVQEEVILQLERGETLSSFTVLNKGGNGIIVELCSTRLRDRALGRSGHGRVYSLEYRGSRSNDVSYREPRSSLSDIHGIA